MSEFLTRSDLEQSRWFAMNLRMVAPTPAAAGNVMAANDRGRMFWNDILAIENDCR